MPARPRTILVGLALIAGLAPGCERARERASGDASTNQTGQASGFDPDARALAELPEHPVTVTLIEAGAEPREALRHAAYGSTREVVLRTETIHDGEVEPFIALTLSWAGADAGSEAFGYRWAVVSVGDDFMGDDDVVDEEFDAFRDRLAKGFEKLRGQATGAGTGLTRIIQTEGMQATPSPVAQLYLFAVPLPDAAVGVGAVWERTTDPSAVEEPEGPKLIGPLRGSRPPAPGEAAIQTERYTLVGRSGPALTIDYETRLQVPGRAQPEQTGSGRYVVVLGDPLVQAGRYELVTSLSFSTAEEDDAAKTLEPRQRISLETVAPRR